MGNAPHQYVIVGGGQAGGWAAKTLRDRGFAGRIVLLGEEEHLPHERPPLSKAVLLSGEVPTSLFLWPAEKLKELDIDLQLGARVVQIDRSKREILRFDGSHVAYDRLLLATGARPRKLSCPGVDLGGIHYLRTIADSLSIRQSLQSAGRLLVVGGGWIGLEVAAAAVSMGVKVTLVEAGEQLCGRSLPKESAAYFHAMHVARGVDIRLNARPTSFEGAGRVERVAFDDGSSLDISIAVIGIGVEPNVELAVGCGLEVDNGIVVNEATRSSDPTIFAAGDVARHPAGPGGRMMRFESWQNAQNQGIVAAKVMLGDDVAHRDLPWFWSDQYDLNFQLVGIPSASDKVLSKGDPRSGRFIQYFVDGSRLTAAAAFNSPRDLRDAKRAMLSDRPFGETGLT
ncbi:NAD(P)/FAD-dependent oxidoreductase [Bosea sp. NPDC003192]|uniref:NAD(P)/FAD-dependent oxidoreductase n=1 Tax=Bosea sp. NPDC003192 TaxID=3390551 RepID=UPI003D058D63